MAVKAGLRPVPIPDCRGEEKEVLWIDWRNAEIRHERIRATQAVESQLWARQFLTGQSEALCLSHASQEAPRWRARSFTTEYLLPGSKKGELRGSV